ncbi:MAG: NitT/TauT family transport system substrate-binding protein [Thiomicrorhabdus sp.]|nr:MAG: NitT/TauT family transport system substrate-binding protein [Thiomicrorhabdus sp.]
MKTNLIKSILLLVVFSLLGCTSPKEQPLKIIVNSWIGYSPLFYLKEKGWLDQHNIKITTVISLGESVNIYETAELDAFTGTQYEFNLLQQQDHSLMPVIMFDRSNGGDVIMSNISLNSLQNTNEIIDVYLEINSVNSLVFKDFVKQHNLSEHQFNFINKDQLQTFSILKQANNTRPSLVASYTPYSQHLEAIGFHEVASTKQGLELLVVDALFTNKETFIKHQKKFTELKRLIDLAIADLKNDPKDYYNKVSPYLENASYEEFLTSLKGIEWLNEPLDPKLIERLNQSQFPVRNLL